MFALVLILPLLPEHWRIPGLLIVAGLSQLIIAPVNVLWTSWMADLVPEKSRGRYFGFRNGFLGLIGTLGNLAAGQVLDAMGKPWGFLLILFVGVILGVGAAQILRWQYEPKTTAPRPSFAEFISPLGNRQFRGFLGFVVFFMGAVNIGGPFVVALWLQYDKMSFAQVGLWTVIAASCGLITSPLWGRIADRVGHWKVLLWTSSIAALVLPPLWLLARPGHLETIWISAVGDALAWGGIGTALTNIALQSAQVEKRNFYLSVYLVALALGSVLGSLLGGALGSLKLGPSPYHLPILVSMGVRILAIYYLSWRIRRDAGRKSGDKLQAASNKP
jgi:MFS family permease